MLAMIAITPDPVAFTIGSFPIHWYGICYAVGLAAVYFVLVHEARYRGEDEALVGNALIIVAIAALIGGRAVPRHRPVAGLRGGPHPGDPAGRPPA